MEASPSAKPTSIGFDPTDFVNLLGRRLILEFDGASAAGTPGLIGDSREGPARTAFDALLPGGAAVGTGLVIDSDGGVSNQQDIVVYERDISPVYSINNVASSTYFPVEGVVAVGEVKSALGQRELEDAFAKIASVKRLRRHSVPEPSLGTMIAPYRPYGSRLSMAGTKDQEFSQAAKHTDQVCGFILCNKFALTASTMLERAEALWSATERSLAPTMIVSMTDGFIMPSTTERMLLSPLAATHVSLREDALLGFAELVRVLNRAFANGRSVPAAAFDRYLAHRSGTTGDVLTRPLQ